MTKIKNLKDLIMLMLAADGTGGQPNAPISGRTRLMKMIFLFNEEIKKDFLKGQDLPSCALPKFEAYDYGPFSAEVYAALEWLVNMGFVVVHKESVGLSDMETENGELTYWMMSNDETDSNEKFDGDVFVLTDLGKGFMKKMKPIWGITDEQDKILSEFKKRCVGVSLRTLLTYVYQKYPKTTDKSKIRDEILYRQ